jgi:MFS family permease
VARPVLPAAILERGLLTFMFFGIDAYVSLTLEDHRGLSAIAAGIALTAATVSWTAGSWIQAKGSERWSTDRFVRAGFIVALIGLASFSLVLIPEIPVWVAVPTFAVAGLGMGLGYAPLSLIVLREAPAETQGAASSALSLLDTLGTALGTGVSGAIVAASLRMNGDPVQGLAGGFAVALLVGLLGLSLTGRLHSKTVPAERTADHLAVAS